MCQLRNFLSTSCNCCCCCCCCVQRRRQRRQLIIIVSVFSLLWNNNNNNRPQFSGRCNNDDDDDEEKTNKRSTCTGDTQIPKKEGLTIDYIPTGFKCLFSFFLSFPFYGKHFTTLFEGKEVPCPPPPPLVLHTLLQQRDNTSRIDWNLLLLVVVGYDVPAPPPFTAESHCHLL